MRPTCMSERRELRATDNQLWSLPPCEATPKHW
jgi:hypothetical protein